MSTALDTQPTRQALAIQGRSRPGKVTGKLRVAIEAMVWEGASRKDAAEIANLSDHGLRQALRRPHVLAHYRSECEVLRTSGLARRLHRLEQLGEQDDNRNAAVAAIKVALQLDDEHMQRGGSVALPGLTIVIQQPATSLTPHMREIEAKPLSSNGDGRIASEALPNQGDADR